VHDLKTWLQRWEKADDDLDVLRELLADEEVAVLIERGRRLVDDRRHPQPSPDWPAIPWPPF
jgi:hypothetical protein